MYSGYAITALPGFAVEKPGGVLGFLVTSVEWEHLLCRSQCHFLWLRTRACQKEAPRPKCAAKMRPLCTLSDKTTTPILELRLCT
ncbi:hypothetical protein ElyMa_004654000 [Elysia marginata]|uniref:Uncharacterized protein n=1 Tax=Elysia marginata TaxID=1093978 RepID=A0AAV4I239_9GAST|nr:hypothetical protein ElyMa_004654000 [Elysia marginata]